MNENRKNSMDYTERELYYCDKCNTNPCICVRDESEEHLYRCALCGNWYPLEDLTHWGFEEDDSYIGIRDIYYCEECLEARKVGYTYA